MQMGERPTDRDHQAAPSPLPPGRTEELATRRNHLVVARVSELLFSAHPETGAVLLGKDVTARAQALGQSLSTSYVLGLRAKTRTTPSVHVLQLLADIYDVDLSFFTTTQPLEDIRAERRVRTTLVEGGDAVMMMRAANLTTPAKVRLAAIIEDMLKEDADRDQS